MLVPLLRAVTHGKDGALGSAAAPWQLDPTAGVHHMSDRLANGPRKYQEKYAATLRESELVVCRGARGARSRTNRNGTE